MRMMEVLEVKIESVAIVTLCVILCGEVYSPAEVPL
jgi:hypothetical protein